MFERYAKLLINCTKCLREKQTFGLTAQDVCGFFHNREVKANLPHYEICFRAPGLLIDHTHKQLGSVSKHKNKRNVSNITSQYRKEGNSKGPLRQREETRCCHYVDYSSTSSKGSFICNHLTDLWYTSRGAFAGIRNSLMGLPWRIDSTKSQHPHISL